MNMIILFAGLALSSAALAQDAGAPASTATPQPAAATPVAAEIVAQKMADGPALPLNTEIPLSVSKTFTTKEAKVGDKLDFTVARDIMMGDYVVIPRGTPAHGRIARRTGVGAWGKPGKMDFDLVDIQLREHTIPVSGHYRVIGAGNTGATVTTAILAGVFATLVTGHTAVVAEGSEWKAHTAERVPFTTAAATASPAAVTAATPAVQATGTAQPVPPASAASGGSALR